MTETKVDADLAQSGVQKNASPVECVDLQALAQILATKYKEELRGKQGLQGLNGINGKDAHCMCVGCGDKTASEAMRVESMGPVSTMSPKKREETQEMESLRTKQRSLQAQLDDALRRLKLAEGTITELKKSFAYSEK